MGVLAPRRGRPAIGERRVVRGVPLSFGASALHDVAPIVAVGRIEPTGGEGLVADELGVREEDRGLVPQVREHREVGGAEVRVVADGLLDPVEHAQERADGLTTGGWAVSGVEA